MAKVVHQIAKAAVWMVSNSEKAKFSNEYANAERSLVRNYFERVETRRHPSK